MFRKNKKLLSLEKIIIESLLGAIPAEISELLKKQLLTLNKIQRIDSGKEVDLYYKPEFSNSEAVVNRIQPCIGESKFATIKFKLPEQPCETDVDFWLVNGYLFSMNFSDSPKDYVNTDAVEIKEIQIHRDRHICVEWMEKVNQAIASLKESKKISIDSWELFEKNDITKVIFEKEEFYIFAKHISEAQFLLIKCDDNVIYYIDHEDSEPIKLNA